MEANRLKLIEESREKERKRQIEEKLTQRRFANRKCLDHLINPILSLSLVEKYGTSSLDRLDFPKVPDYFEHPQDFIDTWTELALYETFNQLINQKTQSDKEAELAR